MEHMRKGSPASHRFRREYYGQVATFLQLSRKLRILTDGNARDNWVNLKRSHKYIRNLAGAGPATPPTDAPPRLGKYLIVSQRPPSSPPLHLGYLR